MNTDLLHQLQALHVDDMSAAAAAQLSSSLTEALQYLDRDAQGQLHEHHKKWKEYWCVKNQRLYYVNNAAGYNSWDAPPCVQFQEWLLDSQLYPGLTLTAARDLYRTLDRLLTAAPPEQVQQSLAVLAKIVNNVVACNNTQPQFRTLKLSNPKLQQHVWSFPAAAEVLYCLGWARAPPAAAEQAASEAQVVSLPADVPLGPLQAAASRLQRLVEQKGHSGQAEHVAPDGTGAGSSGRPPSKLYGCPGFLYQQQIWHCSVCDHAINDGSERLWTGRADAPHGEYRFHCTTCTQRFNLCETCWDAMTQGGAPLHPAGHSFEHIGPRMTRHNDYYGSSGSGADAWGRQARPIPGRSWARLKERTGVSTWG